jgi:hypothetical protein
MRVESWERKVRSWALPEWSTFSRQLGVGSWERDWKIQSLNSLHLKSVL